MKKSLSSTNLPNLNRQSQTQLRKSPSTNSLSYDIIQPMSTYIQTIGTEIQKEVELEAVLHISPTQLNTCAITNKEFPSDILHHIDKQMAECLMEPELTEEEQQNTFIRQLRSSYAELYNTCEQSTERYMQFLRRIRQIRKKNIQEI